MPNLKEFSAYINLVFPGGALFLVRNDAEFKGLSMHGTDMHISEGQPLSCM